MNLKSLAIGALVVTDPNEFGEPKATEFIVCDDLQQAENLCKQRPTAKIWRRTSIGWAVLSHLVETESSR